MPSTHLSLLHYNLVFSNKNRQGLARKPCLPRLLIELLRLTATSTVGNWSSVALSGLGGLSRESQGRRKSAPPLATFCRASGAG